MKFAIMVAAIALMSTNAMAQSGDWVRRENTKTKEIVLARTDLFEDAQINSSAYCGYRANKNLTMNGIWIGFEIELLKTDGSAYPIAGELANKDGEGELAIILKDKNFKNEDGLAYFAHLDKDSLNYIQFETNQTDSLDSKNDNPALVMMPREVTVPTKDGKSFTYKLKQEDPVYQAMLKDCKAYVPVPKPIAKPKRK